MSFPRVGFFDSGLGGLSVARAFLRIRPAAPVVYTADWENCPYGDKSDEAIRARALQLADALVREHGCAMVVVACNTASAVALDAIRAAHPDVPVVGMEPAAKPAAATSRTGCIGILATEHTLRGKLFRETVGRHAAGVRVETAVGEGFVELAEAGDVRSAAARETAARVLKPLLAAQCDPIVLGCTHYPLLLPLLRAVAPHARFLDPSEAVARRVAALWDELPGVHPVPGDRLLGRYAIRSETRGAFGGSFRCTDTATGADVAVERLPPDLARNDAALGALRKRCRAAAVLRHRAISAPRRLESDSASGNWFLVSDYVEVETLADLLARRGDGPMAPAEAIPILRPVAAALDYAARRGVLHGNLRPETVRIRPAGADKRAPAAKLTGFGLPLALPSPDPDNLQPYVAPELLNGRSRTPASDQYVLALLAYRMLSGVLPVDTGSLDDFRQSVLVDHPEPLPGLPPAANEAFRRAFSKRRTRRFPSCAAFLRALSAATGVRDPGAIRRRFAIAGAAVLSAAALAGLALAVPALVDAVEDYRERAAAERAAEAKAAWEAAKAAAAERAAHEPPAVVSPPAETEQPAAPPKPEKPEPEAETPAADSAGPAAAEEMEDLADPEETAEPAGPENPEEAVVETEIANERKVVRAGAADVALRWCPPGSFAMGTPPSEPGRFDDETQHEVTFSEGFWIGETEVTQGFWKEVMDGENPSFFKAGDDYPVDSVSWTDGQSFLEALNRKHPVPGFEWRLPTEAQWEYACRAGTETPFYWGSVLNGGRANCNGNYPYGTRRKGPFRRATTPVGSFAPNPWGLYDMNGNVWEWCSDWYALYPDGPATDPTGPETGSVRVRRGGSWSYFARFCRAGARSYYAPEFRYYYLGLRVVLVPVATGAR